MAYIPTTERKYYNTEKKLNTLAAYSSAMLPAAQNLQEVIAQQEEIKMDSYALEARMEMNEITNNWRTQNEGNPTDPTALKDLQSQYDDVLGKYREQVDPLYRYNWDIAGNKLKGAFDLQNQEWGFAQKQKNARANIARSVDNYIKLAYQYGQEDSEAEAMADFAQSYQKLLDYGAKNLGAEDAAKLLGSYQETFYKSYLDGLVEKNPEKALEMLKDKDNYGILSHRDYEKYKNYAHARKKEYEKETYKTAYYDFMEDPTEQKLDNLYKLNPDMKEKQKIFIRGNKDRGDEIRGLLVGLGATNYVSCDNDNYIYFINHENKISATLIDSEVGRIIMDNYKEIKLPGQEWKDGDVLICDKWPGQCAVFKKYREDDVFETYFIFDDGGLSFNATAPVELYHLANGKELEEAVKMLYAVVRKIFEVSKKLEKK